MPKQLKQMPHQGMAADISDSGWIQEGTQWDFPSHTNALYVVVDHIEDPQNLGAIARASALLGASALVFAKDRQVGITPAVVKASSGMVFALDLIRVSNLATFLTTFKKHAQGWVYGLALERARPLREIKATGASCLVVGSEGKGISPAVAKGCDEMYTIPMAHKGHSLNVAQATAIALYQLSL